MTFDYYFNNNSLQVCHVMQRVNHSHHMTTVSFRVLPLATYSTTSDTVVSKYMAQMLDVVATRRMVTSYYVPEAILQETAAHYCVFQRVRIVFPRSTMVQTVLYCK